MGQVFGVFVLLELLEWIVETVISLSVFDCIVTCAPHADATVFKK